MTKKLLFLFSITIFFLCSNLIAQNIETDRPDQTESANTIPKGGLQIETGITGLYAANDIFTTQQWMLPSTLIRVGLSNNIELRVENQFQNLKLRNAKQKDARGIGDLAIGTKIRLLQTTLCGTTVAFLTHLVLPTGTSGISNDRFGTVNKIAISHDLSDKLSLGYNIGYNNLNNPKGDITYSVAAGYKLSDRIGLYVEPYGEYNNLGTYFGNVDAGITFLAKPNLQFDYSFGTGYNHEMNYQSVGISWYLSPGKLSF